VRRSRRTRVGRRARARGRIRLSAGRRSAASSTPASASRRALRPAEREEECCSSSEQVVRPTRTPTRLEGEHPRPLGALAEAIESGSRLRVARGPPGSRVLPELRPPHRAGRPARVPDTCRGAHMPRRRTARLRAPLVFWGDSGPQSSSARRSVGTRWPRAASRIWSSCFGRMPPGRRGRAQRAFDRKRPEQPDDRQVVSPLHRVLRPAWDVSGPSGPGTHALAPIPERVGAQVRVGGVERDRQLARIASRLCEEQTALDGSQGRRCERVGVRAGIELPV
jgi:hypothetical protein